MPPRQQQQPARPIFGHSSGAEIWGLGPRRAGAGPQTAPSVPVADPSGGGGASLLGNMLSLTNLGMNVYDRFWGEDAAKAELYKEAKQASIAKTKMEMEEKQEKQTKERIESRAEGVTGQKATPALMQHFQQTQSAMREPSRPEIAPLASPTVIRPDGLNVPNITVKPYTDVTPIIGREAAALRGTTEEAVRRQPAGPARDRVLADVVYGPKIMLPEEVPEAITKYAGAGTAAGTETLKEREVSQAQSMDASMQRYRETRDPRHLEAALSHTGAGPKQLLDLQTERGKNMTLLMDDLAKREVAIAAAKTPEQRNIEVERYNIAQYGFSLATGSDKVRIFSRVTTPGTFWGENEKPMRSINVDRDTAQRYITRQIDDTTPEGLLTIAGLESAVGKQADDRFTPEDAATVSDWIDKRPGRATPQTREEAKNLVRQFTTAAVPGAPPAGPPTPAGIPEQGPLVPGGGTAAGAGVQKAVDVVNESILPEQFPPKGSALEGLTGAVQIPRIAAPTPSPAQPAPSPSLMAPRAPSQQELEAVGRKRRGQVTVPPEAQTATAPRPGAEPPRPVVGAVPEAQTFPTPRPGVEPPPQVPQRNYVGQVSEAQTGTAPRPGVEPPVVAPPPARPPMPIPQSPRTGPAAVLAPQIAAQGNLKPDTRTYPDYPPPGPPGTFSKEGWGILPGTGPSVADAQRLADQAAARHGVPRDLMRRIIARESSWAWWVIGDHKDKEQSYSFGGMKQSVADGYRRQGLAPALNVKDPLQNIEATALHLGVLMRRYNGVLPVVVAAYNWGETNANSKSWRPQTRDYVNGILNVQPDDAQIRNWMSMARQRKAG